ncbi:uncharacterized protein LOC110431167 [Sorghum bicolor]|nr:uncharacterized protein LOC110431167 [Sorghum bicolor]|eukprot:XP_021305559.1 uncharacterized protein LOC110431167 [Sorghum bicolor]
MASGSESHGCGSHDQGSYRACTEAPPADNTIITPQLNPEFEAMTAMELTAHLNHSRRTSDFADAALVFAARERRLNEAEALIHMSNEHVDKLKGEIKAHEYSALMAKAQIHRAAKMEMGLRAEIHTLQLKATDVEARGRHASGISGCRLTQPTSHGLSSIKMSYGKEVDHEVSKDVLGARVIASHKVPKEDAQGEEVAASHHSRSQGEQPVRASKKAGRQDGVSIYTSVFVALKEKQERLLKMEKEKALAREAAATSKQLECRCWWSDAPYDVKEDSNDGLNDS